MPTSILLILLLISTPAQSFTIWESNFETVSPTYSCWPVSQSQTNVPWNTTDGCSYWGSGADLFEGGLRAGFGRSTRLTNGGIGMSSFREDIITVSSFYGAASNWVYGENNVTEWYHSWSMKWPENFDKAEINPCIDGFCHNGTTACTSDCDEGFDMKFWRYVLNQNGVYSAGQIFLNSKGHPQVRADGSFHLSYDAVVSHYMEPVLLFANGRWNWYQLHIKLNTSSKGVKDSSSSKQLSMDGNYTMYDTGNRLGVFSPGDAVRIKFNASQANYFYSTRVVDTVAGDGSSMTFTTTVPALSNDYAAQVYVPNNDGETHLWINGDLVFECGPSTTLCGMVYGPQEALHRHGVTGLGNADDWSPWQMTDPTAITFDDVRVTTEFQETPEWAKNHYGDVSGSGVGGLVPLAGNAGLMF